MESKAQEIQKRFADLAKQNRLPHAILLEGGNERELTRLAKQIAVIAVCTDAQKKPCGKCINCGKAKKDNHPDVITVAEKDKKRKTISVDLIRWMREDAIVKPNEAMRKIYCIPKAGTMTREAQNALLKLLEEPPAYAVFILQCSRATELLPTIRSRSQIYSLTENPVLTPAVTDLASDIAAAILSSNEADLLLATAPLLKTKDREKFTSALTGLELILRDCCVLRAGGKALLSDTEAVVQALSKAASHRTLLRMLEEIQTIRSHNERNGNLALLITCLCIHLHRLIHH